MNPEEVNSALFERNCAVLAEWYAGKCQLELQVTNAMGGWVEADQTVQLQKTCEYRLKPATILVNGIEVPKPVREPLEVSQKFWVVDLASPHGVNKFEWHDNAVDIRELERGLIHLTEEAARQHFEALIAPSKVTK